jgi:hypothetical protein
MSTTPSVARPTANATPGVSGSPSRASPNTAVCTGSILMIAVTTENERSRMAASMSAVARIWAVAPRPMNVRKEPFGPGILSPKKILINPMKRSANGKPYRKRTCVAPTVPIRSVNRR